MAQLSLSRLNHWLPRREAHPEVMQSTAQFHHNIPDALLPQPDPVFDDATALRTAVDMLNPQPTAVQHLVGHLLCQRELLAAWFLRGHEDRHLRECERQEAQILQSLAPDWERVGGGLSEAQIMHTAAMGLTQQQNGERGIDQQDIFHRGVFVLAAITLGLFRSVLGADAAPFRPVMGTRGEAGATAGTATAGAGSSSSGTTTVAASASETPRRGARAVRERAGASPRARRAARSTGRRT
jgi:hypothetical protein